MILRSWKPLTWRTDMKTPGARGWQCSSRCHPGQTWLYLSWRVGMTCFSGSCQVHYHTAMPGVTEQKGLQTKLRHSNSLIYFYRSIFHIWKLWQQRSKFGPGWICHRLLAHFFLACLAHPGGSFLGIHHIIILGAFLHRDAVVMVPGPQRERDPHALLSERVSWVAVSKAKEGWAHPPWARRVNCHVRLGISEI